jgi:hypothetical protein
MADPVLYGEQAQMDDNTQMPPAAPDRNYLVQQFLAQQAAQQQQSQQMLRGGTEAPIANAPQMWQRNASAYTQQNYNDAQLQQAQGLVDLTRLQGQINDDLHPSVGKQIGSMLPAVIGAIGGHNMGRLMQTLQTAQASRHNTDLMTGYNTAHARYEAGANTLKAISEDDWRQEQARAKQWMDQFDAYKLSKYEGPEKEALTALHDTEEKLKAKELGHADEKYQTDKKEKESLTAEHIANTTKAKEMLPFEKKHMAAETGAAIINAKAHAQSSNLAVRQYNEALADPSKISRDPLGALKNSQDFVGTAFNNANAAAKAVQDFKDDKTDAKGKPTPAYQAALDAASSTHQNYVMLNQKHEALRNIILRSQQQQAQPAQQQQFEPLPARGTPQWVEFEKQLREKQTQAVARLQYYNNAVKQQQAQPHPAQAMEEGGIYQRPDGSSMVKQGGKVFVIPPGYKITKQKAKSAV